MANTQNIIMYAVKTNKMDNGNKLIKFKFPKDLHFAGRRCPRNEKKTLSEVKVMTL